MPELASHGSNAGSHHTRMWFEVGYGPGHNSTGGLLADQHRCPPMVDALLVRAVDQVGALGFPDGVDAGYRAQLRVDAREMSLDGALADVQAGGDLRVAHGLRDQPEYLQLPS